MEESDQNVTLIDQSESAILLQTTLYSTLLQWHTYILYIYIFLISFNVQFEHHIYTSKYQTYTM